MNPTLEVQITAKLDQLDAGLKVAEAKISKSAVTMGKTGEKAGANFMESFAGNLPMMMVATAMAKTIGGGLLQAVQDVNAGKSGEDIGLGFAQGIVDGAKSLPVVGVVFGILDELVNGASRYIDKLNESVTKSVEKYISSMQAMRDATENFKKSATEKVEDVADAGDPAAMARRAAERQNKKIDDDVEAAKELGREARRAQRKSQDDKDKASMAGMEGEGKTGDIRRALAGEISREEQMAQEQKASDSARRRAKAAGVEADAKLDALAAAAKLANIQEAEKKITEAIKKAQDDKSAATEKTAGDPAAMARRAAERQNKKIDDDVEAAKELGREARRVQRKSQDDKDKASMAGIEGEGKTGDIRRALAGEMSREEQMAQEQKASDSARRRAEAAGVEADAKLDALAAAAKLVNIQEAEKKIAEAIKTATDRAAAEAVKVSDKATAEAKKAADELLAVAKQQKKDEFDAAMQAQDEIIKGEQTVQKKADKAKVFSEAVSSAGQGFINSGQTALGQFNFAQQGAGSSAIDIAKKQVASLEKIEQATAEQVRLTKENKGFQ